MKSMPKRRLTSIPNAAMELGLSRASVYRLHQAGRLPFVRIGGRTLVDIDDIDRLVATSKE